jgi:mRNA interferase HicA
MKSAQLLRLLRKAGWYPESQKGSHTKLIHPDRKDFIIFPNHGSKEVGKGLEKKLESRRVYEPGPLFAFMIIPGSKKNVK